jgi:RNA polymerase sigma factor (sigma-70 family)
VTVFSGNRTLLEAFRRGERAALTAVYQVYVDDVAELVRCGFTLDSHLRVRGVRAPDRQRDLVQEVFLRALSAPARTAFDGISPYRPYLRRIAKNLMIDEARKAGRQVEVEAGAEESPGGGADPELPSPEEDLEWRRLREATRAYCSSLSDPLRRFVRVRFEEEQSQRDAAEALQVTRRKVRTWEEELREGLRRYLVETRARPRPALGNGSGRSPGPEGSYFPSAGRPKVGTGS